MKQATVTYNLTKEGHHVVRENVTPAEHLLIVAEHHMYSGGKPVVSVVPTGDTTKIEVEEEKDDGKGNKTKVKVTKTVAERTSAEEVRRLRERYAGNKIAALFPGASPTLPTSYEEAEKIGVQTILPTSRLTEFKVV